MNNLNKNQNMHTEHCTWNFVTMQFSSTFSCRINCKLWAKTYFFIYQITPFKIGWFWSLLVANNIRNCSSTLAVVISCRDCFAQFAALLSTHFLCDSQINVHLLMLRLCTKRPEQMTVSAKQFLFLLKWQARWQWLIIIMVHLNFAQAHCCGTEKGIIWTAKCEVKLQK